MTACATYAPQKEQRQLQRLLAKSKVNPRSALRAAWSCHSTENWQRQNKDAPLAASESYIGAKHHFSRQEERQASAKALIWV